MTPPASLAKGEQMGISGLNVSAPSCNPFLAHKIHREQKT